MARFKIVAQAVKGDEGDYRFEMEALAALDVEIIEVPTAPEEAMIEAARDADAFYAKPGAAVSRRLIESMTRCRVIALGFVGADTVDVNAATERGIPVTNVPDTFIEEVAGHTMMLLLAAHRRLIVQDRMVREGKWFAARPILDALPRLMGQTIGFIAFGHVPRGVARRLLPFGVRMLAYDPFIAELEMSPFGVEPATLAEVLEGADFVLMHAPARPSLDGMIGEAEFRRMKPNAIFINSARGALVQEAALIRALREGWIAGATLDVLETEPPEADNPLLGMENVTLTAHVASASARFAPARKRRVGHELAEILRGHAPMSCINPSVLPDAALRRWQPIPMTRGPNA